MSDNIGAGAAIPNGLHSASSLDAEAKSVIRAQLVLQASKLVGIAYDLGAEWTDFSKPPAQLDCSEMVEGIFKLCKLDIPDGSQNQYNDTIRVEQARPGDLAFFGKGADPLKIYHVGMVYDEARIIEARAFDPAAKFETGKVIFRPRDKWEGYKNFVGYRSHKKLVL